MKKFHYFIFLFVILPCFFASNESFPQDRFNYSETWNSWGKNERLNWVLGFGMGQDLIFEELKIKEKKKYKYYVGPYDVDLISDTMTQYYKDAANSRIPWQYMAYVAKMKLKGKSHLEIEKELELLREYVDWQRKPKE